MSDPTTEFDLYRRELLEALGPDDPVKVMRDTIEEVKGLVAGASEQQLAQPTPDGGWSPHQVVNHLADNDLVFGVRVRMIVTQERPALLSYDQDTWTDRFGRLEDDPHDTLLRWQALRRANLRVYDSLSEVEWARIGLHIVRGEQSVRDIVRLLAGHDRVHLDQLRRGLGS